MDKGAEMKCLIRWYCGKCNTEYTAETEVSGSKKCECPKCKEETNYDEIFELETLQIG